ncbi:hypothetical protein GCM10008090_25350 [Arenicella chitinivorans]|uniref:Thioredoxin domain-containing protein n=1 Tax=Arenicella chitinivorans TaxID=1329800 RepID=A0A918RWV5_9GAMM|nr:hypothetical protein [Arenicella chitinivorans]GHA14488.1 hypothetical protein GCM10008090_25350 [Arenicella chitinivorans]
MPHITFVKKILANGELCKKCLEVSTRLESEALIDSIDQIAIADERDADSEGARLARKHDVTRAPFFLVEHDDGQVEVFDIYFKFKKFMASQGVGSSEKIAL